MIALRNKGVIKFLTQGLYDLPTSVNLNYFYNYGSISGICLVTQIVTGFFLATHYVGGVSLAFDSISHIVRDLSNGWFLRLIHANGASFFFICIYIHVGRSLYYSSYLNYKTWFSGVLIFVLSILIAFMGYVLVWGQISYWAATVITNLLSVIPYVGTVVVEWLWGGFSIGGPTLTRFYVLHFIAPFILVVLFIIHLIFLHGKLTAGPRGVKNWDDISWFHPYYTWSDFSTVLVIFLLLFVILDFYPYTLLDPENFQEANIIITPEHILPEWYFLPFYAILRSIPNKLLGVVALLASLLILLLLPLSTILFCRAFSPWHKVWYWIFVANFIFLGYIGIIPVEDPYSYIGLLSSIGYYFLTFICHV